MTYEQTLDFLYMQLPMYQREGKSAYKKDLKNTLALCKILGNPEKKFKSIHIAGTNGKGSTAHMLASVFQEAGYKTGLYTSPHLKDYRERIRINGEMISKDHVIQFVERYNAHFDRIKPSFFEWSVSLAFQSFAEKKVDIAIIETGLGGRLDSTNVIIPELSMITNIGLDHTDMLGDKIELIAFEKAGIIKRRTPLVVSEHSGQKSLFNKIALEKESPIYFADELKTNFTLKTDLLSEHQKKNVNGIIQGWFELRKLGWKISFPQLKAGIKNVVKNTQIRGRWEIIGTNPLVVADVAHNKEGLTISIQQAIHNKAKKIHFVIGFVNDKKIDSIIQLFPKEAAFYFCQANIPRALDAYTLEKTAKKYGLLGKSYLSVQEAFEDAKISAKPSDMIYIGGSNFVVAEVL